MVVTTSRKYVDAVARIARYARAHEDEEIGVLVFRTKNRKAMYTQLQAALEGTGVRVQTYGYAGGKNQAADLVFDEGGTVTVLCYASGKGLEFDAVFLPELQERGQGDADDDDINMQLYVMCARARKHLSLMITDPRRRNKIWNYLPPPTLFTMEDT